MTSRSWCEVERAGDLLGRGADIDEQRAVVGNQRGRGAADRLLLLGGDEAARLVGEVLDAGRDDRAAMDARQRALVAEVVEILADGLRRHVERRVEVVDHHPALRPGDIQDFRLTMGQSGHDAPRLKCGHGATASRESVNATSAAASHRCDAKGDPG